MFIGATFNYVWNQCKTKEHINGLMVYFDQSYTYPQRKALWAVIVILEIILIRFTSIKKLDRLLMWENACELFLLFTANYLGKWNACGVMKGDGSMIEKPASSQPSANQAAGSRYVSYTPRSPLTINVCRSASSRSLFSMYLSKKLFQGGIWVLETP